MAERPGDDTAAVAAGGPGEIGDVDVNADGATAVAVAMQPLTEAAAVQLQDSESLVSAYRQPMEV